VGEAAHAPLIECVPNFSEGRDPAVIAALTAAIAAHPVGLLDVTSDADHHRTVITFAGSPEAVSAAMFEAARVAVQCIDLTRHSGEHPRVGAVDVVPFVPLRGVTLADCAALAQRFGARVGAELEIPVYLYEAAARRPERQNLAAVRRPRFEGLRALISCDPAWMPDEGPAQIGSAGAMIVGARIPLIAFNLFLTTADVTIARAIAAVVRESGGGLPSVKALGLLVDGRAQVSLNLTDYRRTGLYAVIQAVREQAARHGTAVERTELIGLIPQAALIAYAADSLGLPLAQAANTLENRLGAVLGDYRPLSPLTKTSTS